MKLFQSNENSYLCDMDPKDLNKKKTPIVKIDKELEKYRGEVLFPKKLKKANEILDRVGLPKA